jgi:hypothetical protein
VALDLSLPLEMIGEQVAVQAKRVVANAEMLAEKAGEVR